MSNDQGVDLVGDSRKLTRRQVVGKAKYVAPLILTFTAAPAFAKTGSTKPVARKRKVGRKPVSRS